MQRVVPAILTANPKELSNDLTVLRGQTSWVHIDIMDGKFVPNTSLSLSELGEASEFFNLEIHLMVQDPEKYFKDWQGIGAKRVIFHWEATDNPEKVLQEMGAYPFYKSMALNSETSVSKLAPYIDKINSVLLLSVIPGFQAQEFISSVLEKTPEVRVLSSEVLIGLDGGINKTNIKEIFEAGADYVGVGSAIMKAENPTEALRELEDMVG